MKKIIFAIALLCSMVAVQAWAQPKVLKIADFENGNTFYTSYGWGDAQPIVVDGETAASGTHSLKISWNRGDGNTWCSSNITLTQPFNRSLYRYIVLKYLRNNGSLRIEKFALEGGIDALAVRQSPRGNTWETVIIDVPANASNAVGWMTLIMNGGTSGTVYIDDIYYTNDITAILDQVNTGETLWHTNAMFSGGGSIHSDDWQVLGWSSSGDSAYWQLNVPQPTAIDIIGNQGTGGATTSFTVQAGGRVLPVTLATSNWGIDNSPQNYGRMTLPAGNHRFVIAPNSSGWNPMQLKNIIVKKISPIKQVGADDIVLDSFEVCTELGATLMSTFIAFTQNGRASWLDSVATAGKYKVSALLNGSANATFVVKIDGTTAFTKTVALSGNRDTVVNLGLLESHAVGKHIVEIQRTDNNAAVNLKNLTFTTNATLTLNVNNGTWGSATKTPDKVTYRIGDTVALNVAPASGYRFASWSGDLTSVKQKDTVVLLDNMTITGNLEVIPANPTYVLTTNISPVSSGTVTRVPSAADYEANTVVKLVATPANHYQFSVWSGVSNAATDTIRYTMPAQASTITANFEKKPYSFSLTNDGTTGCGVSYISTKGQTKSTYVFGDTVIITATAPTGYRLKRWTGHCTSSKAKDTIAIVSNTSINAEFEKAPYTVTLQKNPNDDRYGSVTKTPNKATYVLGDTVKITATANQYFKFVNWTGDLTSTKSTDSIILTLANLGNKSITANFDQAAIQQTADSVMTLPAIAAARGADINSGEHGNIIGGWKSGSISWKIKLSKAATYSVYANYSSDGATAEIEAGVGLNKVRRVCEGVANWGAGQNRKVGNLTLASGEQTLTVAVLNSAYGINFSHIRLVRQLEPAEVSVTVNNAKYGFVTKSPNKTVYENGDSIWLTAVPYPGYKFEHWGGALTSSKAADVVVADGTTAVTANFAKGGAILPDGEGNITLPAPVAVVDAQGIALSDTAIVSWEKGKAVWHIEVACATAFVVKGEIASAHAASGNLNIAIMATDTLNLQGMYTTTGAGVSVYAYQNLATVTLQPGTYQVVVNRVVERGIDNQINLKNIKFEKQATAGITLTTAVNHVNYGKVVATPFKTSYSAADVVALTATPAQGYEFISWSGDLVSTIATVNVTMSVSKHIVANFAPIANAFRSLSLSVNNAAYGSATSYPDGTSFLRGDTVVITATPNPGYRFTGWTGDLISTQIVDSVVMDSNIVAVANFEAIQYTVAVTSNNTAYGTVSKSPEKATYTYGDKIVITATPLTGHRFTGWSGSLVSTKLVDTIYVDTIKTVVGNFEQQYTLTVNSSNTAFGTASKSPDKAYYNAGEKVVVTATPKAGYRFVSWSGDLTSAKPVDTVTMSGNKAVIATFEIIPSTSVSSILADKFVVYPNPFSAQLFIQAKEGLNIETLEVLNMQGLRCIQPIKVNAASITLSRELSALPQGSYFVRINTKQGSITYQVVKK